MKSKRSFAHWTPRYLLDRITYKYWMRLYPSAPWLSRKAVLFIEQWLRPTDCAIEYGSGRSTTWLARHVALLRSIEHDAAWHMTVSDAIASQGVTNVDYHLITTVNDSHQDAEAYSCGPLLDVQDESLDFALIDGRFRDHCALAVLGKLKPGGLLLIDDAERYLPSDSRSPSSVPMDGNCATELWGSFYQRVAGWRKVWFSDGVHDDALFFKPVAGCECDSSPSNSHHP